jgi:hypothetical protein
MLGNEDEDGGSKFMGERGILNTHSGTLDANSRVSMYFVSLLLTHGSFSSSVAPVELGYRCQGDDVMSVTMFAGCSENL